MLAAMIFHISPSAASMVIQKDTTPAGIRKDHIAELQDLLEQDDFMLPYRWRKVSSLTAAARTQRSNEPARNGIDREWVTVAQVHDNYRRLVRVGFEAVQTDAVRIVVDSTWGAEKAHIFAFDVL